MFFRRPTAPNPGASATTLDRAVQAHLPNADEATQRIVTALAGLLGGLAYADRDFTDVEEVQVRRQLETLRDLDAAAVSAICAVLRQDIVNIATVDGHRFTRDLKEHADLELREQIMALLVALAATDGTITPAETTLLRRTAQALGLSQQEYNLLQARYVDRLGILQRS